MFLSEQHMERFVDFCWMILVNISVTVLNVDNTDLSVHNDKCNMCNETCIFQYDATSESNVISELNIK